MIYLYVILFIVIILIIACRPLVVEPFMTDLDISNNEASCFDYVTKELKWEMDHDLEKHLPKAPTATPESIEQQQRKLLDARKSVLEEMDAVKTKVYSGINIDYPFAGSCVYQNDKMLDYSKNHNSCTFTGKELKNDLDPVDGAYGRKARGNVTVGMQTFDQYIQSAAPGANANDFRGQFLPNQGCFLDTEDKDKFFDQVTQMAKMKIFESEDTANKEMAERKRQQEVAAKLSNTLSLYGIDPNIPYDTNMYFTCRTATTSRQDNGGFQYNFLDRLPVGCGSEEMLGGFKLHHVGNQSYYTYKCCKPMTSDNRVRPQITQNKNTNMNYNSWNWSNPWDMNANLECGHGGYLNRFHLLTGYEPNRDYYSYNCSTMYKQFPNDKRNVQHSCGADSYTAWAPTNSGTQNMQQLEVNCSDGALKNVRMERSGGNYRYVYQCCKPYIIES